jgi:hypothetical protein
MWISDFFTMKSIIIWTTHFPGTHVSRTAQMGKEGGLVQADTHSRSYASVHTSTHTHTHTITGRHFIPFTCKLKFRNAHPHPK